MERELDILRDIKRIKAPDDIYASIQTRLKKSNTISMNWIRAAAAIFILLVCFEIYICKDRFIQQEEASSVASAYQVSGNSFYYE